MDGDADRFDATRSDRAATDRLKLTVRSDPQHRDLIAASIDSEQIAPVTSYLQGTLRADPMPSPGTTGRKRRTGYRRQRPVPVTGKRGDRVHTSGVVVHRHCPTTRDAADAPAAASAEPATIDASTIDASSTANRNSLICCLPRLTDRSGFPGPAILPRISFPPHEHPLK